MAKTLQQIWDEYYSEREILIEVTEPAEIKKLMESKASCCWGAGPIGDDWMLLCQPSIQSKGDKQFVYVCSQANIPV